MVRIIKPNFLGLGSTNLAPGLSSDFGPVSEGSIYRRESVGTQAGNGTSRPDVDTAYPHQNQRSNRPMRGSGACWTHVGWSVTWVYIAAAPIPTFPKIVTSYARLGFPFPFYWRVPLLSAVFIPQCGVSTPLSTNYVGAASGVVGGGHCSHKVGIRVPDLVLGG